MATQFDDPDLEECMAASVDRGEFSTLEVARSDFLASIDEAIAEDERGESEDLLVFWARLREEILDRPRAAE